MINKISFKQSIEPRENVNKQNYMKTTDYPDDSFTLSDEMKLKKAVFEAKQKIIQMLEEKNVEQGYVIAPDGTVKQDIEGDKENCILDSKKVPQDSVIIHGHPELAPLSTGDVAALLASDAKSQEAITKDGYYSRLTKNSPFKTEEEYSDLRLELEHGLFKMAAAEIGIDPDNYTKDDVMKYGKKYLSDSCFINCDNMSDNEVVDKLSKFGVKLSGDNNEDAEYIRSITPSLWGTGKDDKIKENLAQIQGYVNSPEGMGVCQEFLQNLADRYDLTYETNMPLE